MRATGGDRRTKCFRFVFPPHHPPHHHPHHPPHHPGHHRQTPHCRRRRRGGKVAGQSAAVTALNTREQTAHATADSTSSYKSARARARNRPRLAFERKFLINCLFNKLRGPERRLGRTGGGGLDGNGLARAYTIITEKDRANVGAAVERKNLGRPDVMWRRFSIGGRRRRVGLAAKCSSGR